MLPRHVLLALEPRSGVSWYLGATGGSRFETIVRLDEQDFMLRWCGNSPGVPPIMTRPWRFSYWFLGSSRNWICLSYKPTKHVNLSSYISLGIFPVSTFLIKRGLFDSDASWNIITRHVHGTGICCAHISNFQGGGAAEIGGAANRRLGSFADAFSSSASFTLW